VAWLVHQTQPEPRRETGEQPPAIERHVDLHGITAEDVAEVMCRRRQEDAPYVP
jgi:hypothetical protein